MHSSLRARPLWLLLCSVTICLIMLAFLITPLQASRRPAPLATQAAVVVLQAPVAAATAEPETPVGQSAPPSDATETPLPFGQIKKVIVEGGAISGQQSTFEVRFFNGGELSWPPGAQVAVELTDAGGNRAGSATANYSPALLPGQSAGVRLELTVPVSATGILSYTASISADGLALAQASGHVLVQDEADVSAASGQDAVVPQAPDAYYGSLRVALVPSASGGSSGTGPIWTSIPEIPGITFGNLPLASVSAGLLSAYDTVALMQVCNVATALTPGQKADLIDWLGNGGKLIIYDSDACSGSNTPSYLWLIYPFTTNNPGQRGAHGGALAVMEENSLSSADPASPYYINTGSIASGTDAVGDANVMVTRDPHWYVDMQATNVNSATGYVHAYAEFGHGLIIYNGLDIDYTANSWLRKLWVLELQQPWDPSGLLRNEPVVGLSSIQVSTGTAAADGSSTVTATLTLRDSNGNRLPGHEVRFTSSRAGIDVFTPASGVTDQNGRLVARVTSRQPGQALIAAYDLTAAQTIASSAIITFTGTPGQPSPPAANDGPIAIVGVKSQLPLAGLYPRTDSSLLISRLDIHLRNRIDVTVDWRGATPGRIEYWLNGVTQTVRAGAAGGSFELNMARDLRPGGNRLLITAYDAAGRKRSDPVAYEPAAWNIPNWALDMMSFTSDIKVEIVKTSPRKLYLWFYVPPKALFSTVDLEVGEVKTGTQVLARLSMPLEGPHEMEIGAGVRYFRDWKEDHWKGMSLAGVDLEGELSMYGRWRVEDFQLMPGSVGGEGKIAIGHEWRKSWLIVLTLFGLPPEAVTFVESIPKLGDFIQDRAYVYLKLAGNAGLDFEYQVAPVRRYDLLDFKLGPSVEVGSKLDLFVVEARIYGGGGLDVILFCVRDAPEDGLSGNLLCGAEGKGYAGLEARALAWERTVEWVWEKRWDRPMAESQSVTLSSLVEAVGMEQGDWRLIGHPSTEGYERFAGADPKLQAFGLAARSETVIAGATLGSILASNVYTYAQPVMTVDPAKGRALLLWVHDELSKPVGQSHDLRFSGWDGTAWSAPAPVTDDALLDGDPQVAWTSSDRVVAVWDRIDTALPPTTTFDVTATRLSEIVTAQFDRTSGTWTAPTRLTNNGFLDVAPALARNAQGQLLAAWRQNEAGILGGDAERPDRVMAAFYNAGWGTPAAAVPAVPDLVELAAGYGQGSGLLAYTRYLTPTGALTPALQLFTVAWNGSVWSAPTQLTDDLLGHHNPQVVYNSAGQPLLIWLAGSELRLRNLATSALAHLTVPEEVGTVDRLNVVQDAAGNLAALLAAETGQRDLWVALYDGAINRWGRPVRLTDDTAAEAYPSAGMDASGRLLVGYSTSAMRAITRTATMSATGQLITYTVPAVGQTDLATLAHLFVRDLTAADDGLAISDPHPQPGATVVLSATVRNAGDLPVEDLAVAFYDGDPRAGGALLGTATSPGALTAGFTTTLTMPYGVPFAGAQHRFFAVIDPANAVPEADETNNLVSMLALGPDLAIEEDRVEHWGSGDAALVVRLRNLGTSASPSSSLELHWAAITGTLVVSRAVGPIGAGEAATVTVSWNHNELDPGDHRLVVVANPGEADFPETFTDNNERDLVLRVGPDLAVDPLYVWPERLPDGLLRVSALVYNFGSTPVAGAEVAVYAGDPMVGGNLLFTRTVNLLSPSSSALISGTWAAQDAGYEIYVWADPRGVLTETTRSNNLAVLPAGFELSLAAGSTEIVPEQSRVMTVAVTGRNGFSAPVNLAVGAVAGGPEFTLGTDVLQPGASTTLTIIASADVPEGDYPLVVHAWGGGIERSTSLTLTVVVPDFRPSVVPDTLSVRQYEEGVYQIGVARFHGFNTPVWLSVKGLPAGVTHSIRPNPLLPLNTAVLTVTVAPDATAGVYPLQIAASAEDLTHSVTSTLTVVAATRDLSVVKTLSSGALYAGTDLQYRLQYRLTGNSPAPNVVLTDTLPGQLIYVSESHPAGFSLTRSGNTLVWRKPWVAANESGYIYVTVRIDDETPDGAQLVNTARGSTTRPETTYANNASTITSTVKSYTRDLQVATVLNSGTAVAGNDLVYRITVANQGSAAATDVVVTNTLPLSVTYVSDATTGAFTTVLSDTTTIWKAPVLAAGASTYLYVTGRVNDGLPAGVVLINRSQVSGAEFDLNSTNNVFTRSITTLAPTRDLRVTQTLDQGSPTPGNTMRYTISYANLGNSGARNVVVTDTLPAAAVIVSGSGPVTPTVTGSNVRWDLGRIPATGYAGASGALYVIVRLPEGIATGTALTNTVTVATSDPETSYTNNRAVDTRTVRAGIANLSLDKTFQGSYAAPGSRVSYRLAYQNLNTDAALSTRLTDTLPLGVDYVSSTGAGAPTIAGRVLAWQLGAVPGKLSSAIYVTVEVPSTLPVGTTITNSAVISTSNDNVGTNNADSDVRSLTAPTRDLYADLTLSSGRPVIGTELTLRLAYANNGTASMRGVVLTGTLPTGLRFVSASGPVAPIVTGNTLVWDLGILPARYAPGASDYLYVTVQVLPDVPPGLGLCSRLEIGSLDAESGSSQNVDNLCQVAQAPERDLSLSQSLYSGLPTPGQQMVWRLAYQLAGNSPAEQVMVIATLPAGVHYDPTYGASDSAGWSRHRNGDQLVWTRASLDVGSGYLYVAGRLDPSATPYTPLTNTAQIRSQDLETDYANNFSELVVNVLAPGRDLSVEKSWVGGQCLSGSQLTYRLAYRNSGALTANNVVLTDTLPFGMSYASASYSGWSMFRSGNVITWTRAVLAANYAGQIDLTANISSTVAHGAVLDNVAEIATIDGDDREADNRAELPLAISETARDVWVTQSQYAGGLAPGENVTYRLRYRNAGNSISEDVQVVSTLGEGLQFLSASAGPPPSVQGNRIVWDLGDLPAAPAAGYDGYVDVTARLSPDLLSGSKVCNRADIVTTDPETGLTPNSTLLCGTVEANSRNASVALTVTGGNATPGNTLTYRITYRNDGNSSAAAAVVTASLPADTSFVSASGPVTPVVSGQRVVWQLGVLPPGGVAGSEGYLYVTIQLPETAAPGTVLAQRVEIATTSPETNSTDNMAFDSRNVVAGTSDLSLSMSLASGAAVQGRDLTYRLYYTNLRADGAVGVILTDTLPAGTQYISSTLAPARNGGQLVWRLAVPGRTQPGYDGSIYVTVRVFETLTPGTVLLNEAVISAGNDPVVANNTARDSRTVVAAVRDLSVENAVYAGTLRVGGDVTYRLRYVNAGNLPASGVVLTDTLPQGVTLLSATGPVTPSVAGANVIWRLPVLPPSGSSGASGYIYLRAHIGEQVYAGQALTNLAVIDGEPEGNLTNNSAQATFVARLRWGGPDAAGYSFSNSSMAGGPTYQWTDIATTGAPLWPAGSYYNAVSGPLDLGFSFPFYGNRYGQVYVSTNGYLVFGSAVNRVPPSVALPSSSAPANSIIAFGANLYLTAGKSQVYWQRLQEPARMVIQYEAMDRYSPRGHFASFQVVLYPDGRVMVQYRAMEQAYGAAVVGIQNSTATVGLDYGPELASGLAVLYLPPNVAAPQAPTTLDVSGPRVGLLGRPFALVATASPLTVTLPLTFTWTAEGQAPFVQTVSSGRSSTATFAWTAPGTHAITVRAWNLGGSAEGHANVSVGRPLFLPLLRKP